MNAKPSKSQLSKPHQGLLIDRHEFGEIQKAIGIFEAEREKAIATSREIITLSKQIIYAVHRGDMTKAEGLIPTIRESVSALPAGFIDTDMPRVARQEFVEAASYLEFVKRSRLPTRKELGVEWHEYLTGLCDLTGELVRKAVKDVIEHKYENAKKIHALVDEIYGAFLEFDLRGGELRKKSDSIKWNLKKLEDIMYDIELKQKLEHSESEHEEGA